MNRASDITRREQFILLTALAFMVMNVFAGPLRMYLSMAGLSPLIYVPNLMLLVSIAWQVSFQAWRGFNAVQFIGLLVPLYACVVGLQFNGAIQTAMGIYVLLPFWFGIACAPVLLKHWNSMHRVAPILFAAAAGGIIVNYVVTYPWEGFGYSVGQMDVEGSRQWYATGGTKRLAGFARASFDAAVQVALLGIVIALRAKHAIVRLVLWILTIVAVVPTTSKGMLMVVLVMTPVIVLKERIPRSLLTAQVIVFASLSLILPLSTLLFDFHSQFSNPTLANATYSFYDRLNDMWPKAWALLYDHGNWLMGRGIGGIGTAQSFFEPSMFNAGDNLFMYWFVVFGWAAFPGFLLLFLRSLRIKPQQNEGQMRIYCLLLALMVYGSMTNIVENSMFALVCGLIVRWLCSTPENATVNQPQTITGKT